MDHLNGTDEVVTQSSTDAIPSKYPMELAIVPEVISGAVSTSVPVSVEQSLVAAKKMKRDSNSTSTTVSSSTSSSSSKSNSKSKSILMSERGRDVLKYDMYIEVDSNGGTETTGSASDVNVLDESFILDVRETYSTACISMHSGLIYIGSIYLCVYPNIYLYLLFYT